MLEDGKNVMMAIIMLGDLNPLNNDVLRSTIRARLPDADADPGVDGTGALLILARGATCGIMPLPAPCPISPQDPSFVTAWYWPDAWQVLSKHQAHAIVSVAGGADARTRAVLLGQLIAAVVESASTPLGVHCAASNVLWPAEAALAVAAPGSDVLPLPFCVSAKLSRDTSSLQPGKISAVTQGLAAFSSMEIEVLGCGDDPQTLSNFLLDVASYLIESGAVINDGDTIGFDEKTKIVVRHEASRLAPGQTVYRLYFQ